MAYRIAWDGGSPDDAPSFDSMQDALRHARANARSTRLYRPWSVVDEAGRVAASWNEDAQRADARTAIGVLVIVYALAVGIAGAVSWLMLSVGLTSPGPRVRWVIFAAPAVPLAIGLLALRLGERPGPWARIAAARPRIWVFSALALLVLSTLVGLVGLDGFD